MVLSYVGTSLACCVWTGVLEVNLSMIYQKNEKKKFADDLKYKA